MDKQQAEFARAIVEQMKAYADSFEAEGNEVTRLFALEPVADAMAVFMREYCPSLTVQGAIKSTLLATLSCYMPASKYNGLFFDENLKEPLRLWGDMLDVMLEDNEQIVADGPIGEYDFEYDVEVAPVSEQAEAEAAALRQGLGGAADQKN